MAEHLELDRVSDGELEPSNGVVVALGGACRRHDPIVSDVARALGHAPASGCCLVMAQDQRVHVSSTKGDVYPDVVIVWEVPRFDRDERLSLTNPTAIVEVLSDSTLDRDLGAKLGPCRQLPSIEDVLLVHPGRRAVTLVSRQRGSTCKRVDAAPARQVTVAGVTLPLDVVYERAGALPA